MSNSDVNVIVNVNAGSGAVETEKDGKGIQVLNNNYVPFSSSKYKKGKEEKKKKVYTGRKNETILPEFVDLCKRTQKELKEILPQELIKAGYTDIVVADGFIYAKGNVPVLLTAHMDTVHKETVKDFYERVDSNGKHILESPQGIGGDDRCGIYMILQIIKEKKCTVLFCEDEEVGGIGSSKFCKTELINELSDLKYLIELDRANEIDAVFYDCDNPEFTSFITKNTGYKEDYGSFSDISTLAPKCGVSAVNLSCGYYHAHTLDEEVVIEEMQHTIEVIKELLSIESEQFEYVEAKYNKYGWGYGNYGKMFNGYGTYNDSYYETLYGYTKTKKKQTSYIEEDSQVSLTVYWYEDREDMVECIIAPTKNAAWGIFFQMYSHLCFNDVYDYEIDYI